MNPPTVNILGVELHNVPRAWLLEHMREGVFFNPNVDVIMKLRVDADFHALFHQADFRVCDSRIVQLGSRLLGTPIVEPVPGSDFFGAYCAHRREDPDFRMFLLGAGAGVAQRAQQRINQRLGRDVIVGAHSPSFGFEKKPEESEAIVERINRSGATALAVGVGAPKQEKWIMRHRHLMPGVRLFMAIGATIDFEAGNVQRAPAWISGMGLEWAFRLLREPRRLWRRYLLDDPPFFWHLLRQRMGWDKASGR